MDSAARQELLQIARDAIRAQLDGQTYSPSAPLNPQLSEVRGAFVTLRREGALRGCIGSMEGTRPLFETVAEMALSAAFRDQRFAAVVNEEFGEIVLEISVLSPLKTIDDPATVELGRHGVLVAKGGCRGVLLPQVATQFGWDRETFLEQTCRKAGLPANAWRRGARLQIFEAEVFGETTVDAGQAPSP